MKIYIVFTLIFFSNYALCQKAIDKNSLSDDTLLNWFENYDPLEVLEKVKKYDGAFEAKLYYNSKKLKPYLMLWLDRDLYQNKYIEKTLDIYRDDTVFFKTVVRRLYKDTVAIDSIINNDTIFEKFKEDYLVKKKKEILKSQGTKKKPFPKSIAIDYHTKLAYPESYEIIKEFWKERGEETIGDKYFMSLVQLGDPEARNLYSNYIDKLISSNGKGIGLGLLYDLRGFSYGMKKLIELLEVEREIVVLSDGTSSKFNCEVITMIKSDIISNEIKLSPKINRDSSCEEVKQNIELFIKAAERLVKYYEEQEHYWMSNIPFYEE